MTTTDATGWTRDQHDDADVLEQLEDAIIPDARDTLREQLLDGLVRQLDEKLVEQLIRPAVVDSVPGFPRALRLAPMPSRSSSQAGLAALAAGRRPRPVNFVIRPAR